jgi:hypothetical protein
LHYRRPRPSLFPAILPRCMLDYRRLGPSLLGKTDSLLRIGPVLAQMIFFLLGHFF